MNEQDMIAELLQGLTNDMARTEKKLDRVPTQIAPNYQAEFNRLSQDIQKLSQQTAKADLSKITDRFDDIERQVRNTPQYRLSRYYKYAAIAFVLLLPITAAATWYAFDYKKQFDLYQEAYWPQNWRIRYVKQANPKFYNGMENEFTKDASKVQQWILDQEEAEKKREMARQAAEQAKALSDQAQELEGKGKKVRKNK